MKIGEIVERLIYIKDHNKFTLRELEAINEACNMLSHNFNYQSDSYHLRDSFIASVVWNKEDIEEALAEKGFDYCEDNINKVINHPYLKKSLEERSTERGWDVIYDIISELKDELLIYEYDTTGGEQNVSN